MPAIELVVGLGNPGAEYQATRHNAGFWFADALAHRCGASLRSEGRFQGEVARCSVGGQSLRIHKPMTFMNRSGQAAGALMRFYRIPVESILVVHDDLDLPPGAVRLKKGGGHGGHNGLRDLIAHLGSREFFRLRIGIGHPGHRDQVVDYVLKKPTVDDRHKIEDAIDAALDEAGEIAAGNMQRAMHSLHSREV